MSDESIFLGIYVKVTGPGSESSGRNSKWHVWGNKDGSFLVQQLLPDEKKNGPVEIITDNDFFNNFRIHAAFSAKGKTIPPKISSLDASAKTPAQKKSEPKQNAAAKTNKYYSSVREDQGAFTYYSQKKSKPASPMGEILPDGLSAGRTAKQADESVYQKLERRLRSDFSLALIRLGSNRDEAIKMLTDMAEHEGPFVENHKFMFSEFGLAMRKRKLLVLSVRFHEKAHILSPKDEHILFNLARVFYESGKYDKARICLEEAVNMAPRFKYGRDFLDFIDGR